MDCATLRNRTPPSFSTSGGSVEFSGSAWQAKSKAERLPHLVAQAVSPAFLTQSHFCHGLLESLAGGSVLALTSAIMKLAEILVTERPIPRKAAGDAVHIAVLRRMLANTWNCRQRVDDILIHPRPLGDSSPEKAGGGGSIPSLATT